jgi:ribosome-binding protein aMBF1 (putative translation factor)
MAQTDGSATRTSATGLPNFKLVAVNPNHVDERLGGLLREKRTSRGLSPVDLAKNLRIDPEDISAYESGTKRISTDLLRQIAKVLRFRPVGHSHSSNRQEGRAPRSDPRVTEATPAEVLRLQEGFLSIRDATVRKSILDLVDELAGSV